MYTRILILLMFFPLIGFSQINPVIKEIFDSSQFDGYLDKQIVLYKANNRYVTYTVVLFHDYDSSLKNYCFSIFDCEDANRFLDYRKYSFLKNSLGDTILVFENKASIQILNGRLKPIDSFFISRISYLKHPEKAILDGFLAAVFCKENKYFERYFVTNFAYEFIKF